MIPPTLVLERSLLDAGHHTVAGMDEVGRGALAGPVTVGVTVVDAGVADVPDHLTDSKLLRPAVREALVPAIVRWAVASAVGHASAAEIDELGIIAALRLAGMRALLLLPVMPDAVILDGSHDWLTQLDDLFSVSDLPSAPPVRMEVKADQSCASVAAASVLAKVARDACMVELDAVHPGYGLAGHKGYGSESHRQAIRTLGPSSIHRRTWKLV